MENIGPKASSSDGFVRYVNTGPPCRRCKSRDVDFDMAEKTETDAAIIRPLMPNPYRKAPDLRHVRATHLATQRLDGQTYVIDLIH